MRLCAEPGCPNVVEKPARHCPQHRRAGPSDPAYGYGGARWRRVRDAYLAAHPRCEAPGCSSAAHDVHHVDERRPADPGANDWANLEALCRRCHLLRHRRAAYPLGSE